MLFNYEGDITSISVENYNKDKKKILKVAAHKIVVIFKNLQKKNFL